MMRPVFPLLVTAAISYSLGALSGTPSTAAPPPPVPKDRTLPAWLFEPCKDECSPKRKEARFNEIDKAKQEDMIRIIQKINRADPGIPDLSYEEVLLLRHHWECFGDDLVALHALRIAKKYREIIDPAAEQLGLKADERPAYFRRLGMLTGDELVNYLMAMKRLRVSGYRDLSINEKQNLLIVPEYTPRLANAKP